MSELDEWSKDEKRTTGMLGTLVLGAIAIAGKVLVKYIAKETESATNKANSEAWLDEVNSKSWLWKLTNKKEIKAANDNYDKYH